MRKKRVRRNVLRVRFYDIVKTLHFFSDDYNEVRARGILSATVIIFTKMPRDSCRGRKKKKKTYRAVGGRYAKFIGENFANQAMFYYSFRMIFLNK